MKNIKFKPELHLPKPKFNSSTFLASDSLSDIWNSSRSRGSPYLTPNILNNSSQNKTLSSTSVQNPSKSSLIITPDNRVYKGVKSKEDNLDVLLSKLREFSLERKEKLSLKIEKIDKISPTNLWLRTKIQPQGEMIIKSLNKDSSSGCLIERSPVVSQEFLVEEPKFLYKLPKNRTEFKVSKQKIVFSPQFKNKTRRSLKKQNSPCFFQKRAIHSFTPTNIYSQGKSPLFINSFPSLAR